MPRIGIVCPYAWDRPGGVQSHLRGFVPVLRSRGFDVEILAPVDGQPDDPCVVPGGRSVGIRDNASVVPVALGPAAIARGVRYARDERFDLVHAHEPAIPWLGLAAVATARAPLVGTFHMYSATARWYRPFAPVVRPALARLDVRIAVSEAARRHVARTVPGEYRIIPNGIDVDAIGSVEPRRDGNRILFVGRAEPRKGLPILLEAFEHLPRDTVLDLAGPSPGDVAASGVEVAPDALGRIETHGFLEPDALHGLLARADVLCVPSLRGESFGIVLVEGMAAGLPVVASDVPGYRSVLPEACGRLVPPGDAGALADALRELLADEGLRARLGAAGAEHARRYAWERVATELIAVYEELLDGAAVAAVRARGRASPSRSRRPRRAHRPADRGTS